MLDFMTGACRAPAAASRIERGAVPPDVDLRAAIKAYLRIEDDAQDALIDRLGASAIGHCEGFIGRQAIIRQVQETMPTGRTYWQRLGVSPARVISGVEALDNAGAATVLPTSGYAIDLDAGGDAWVRVIDPGAARVVRITYGAGLASSFAGLPEPIGQGIVRLAAHLFTVRDVADEGAPPAAVAALWRPWRRMRLI